MISKELGELLDGIVVCILRHEASSQLIVDVAFLKLLMQGASWKS